MFILEVHPSLQRKNMVTWCTTSFHNNTTKSCWSQGNKLPGDQNDPWSNNVEHLNTYLQDKYTLDHSFAKKWCPDIGWLAAITRIQYKIQDKWGYDVVTRLGSMLKTLETWMFFDKVFLKRRTCKRVDEKRKRIVWILQLVDRRACVCVHARICLLRSAHVSNVYRGNACSPIPATDRPQATVCVFFCFLVSIFVHFNDWFWINSFELEFIEEIIFFYSNNNNKNE